MTTFVEQIHNAEYISSEANGTRSRDTVTVAAGSALLPGTVLGVVTATQNYVAHDPDASDGSEDAAAILYNGLEDSASDRSAVVTSRDAEVVATLLTWKTGITAPQQTAAIAQLNARGIILR